MHKKLINILVIDDDTIDRRLVERTLKVPLQEVEFAVHAAGTLGEGLERLESNEFDLVLLDLGLPDSCGLETVDRIHEAFSRIPVIVLTGLADEEVGVEAIKRGATDYVVKPFKPDGLRTRIGIVLQIIELQQELVSLANTDELTGMVNRRHFFDILDREILQAKIKSNSLTVMMFDIDRFKSINDNYGHVGGDVVLRQMGKILRENIYPLDVASRYGGDEFIILMPETSSERAFQAAERLRRIIDQWQWEIFDKRISITISIGLANIDSVSLTNSQDLIDRADAALYAAKRQERNCVVSWDQINFDEKIVNSQDKDFHELQTKVSTLAKQLRLLTLGVISSFTKAMNMVIQSSYMVHHGENVRAYALAIAEQMGLSVELKERIGVAALLQDLGKISIPESILKKTTPLTKQERQIIRQHPNAAIEILEPIDIFGRELQIIKHHHENFNGTGYPDGLKGREIPIGARILSLADAFDAITSDHEYRDARSAEEALSEIDVCTGTQFDPEVVEAFKKAFEENKGTWPLSITRAFSTAHSCQAN